MTTILDLKATLAKMPTMTGRRPQSTEAERKACRQSARSPWQQVIFTPAWRRNLLSTRLLPLGDCGLGCRSRFRSGWAFIPAP